MTRFARAVAAELLKMRTRALYRAALVVLLVLPLLPAVIGIIGRGGANSLRGWATAYVAFPGALWNTLEYMQTLLPILIGVVAAGTVGGEYAAGTWKMVLPRARSRAAPLLARLAAVWLTSMAALLFAGAFTTASSWIGAKFLGVPFSTSALHASDCGAALLVMSLEVAFCAALGIAAAVLTRSQIGALLAAVLTPPVLGYATFIPRVGWLLPMTHLEHLQARWIPLGGKVAEVHAKLGHVVAWETSAILVAVATAAVLAAAIWWFEHRDLAGD